MYPSAPLGVQTSAPLGVKNISPLWGYYDFAPLGRDSSNSSWAPQTVRRAKPRRESDVFMYPSAPLGVQTSASLGVKNISPLWGGILVTAPGLHKLLVERSRDESLVSICTPRLRSGYKPRLRSGYTRLRSGYRPRLRSGYTRLKLFVERSRDESLMCICTPRLRSWCTRHCSGYKPRLSSGCKHNCYSEDIVSILIITQIHTK